MESQVIAMLKKRHPFLVRMREPKADLDNRRVVILIGG
jgi:hypothetical protein